MRIDSAASERGPHSSDVPYPADRGCPIRSRRRGPYACDVLVVITHPDHPDMRSLLWFWPGLATPLHFLVTLSAHEAT